MAKLTLWWLRKTIFTKPKPDHPALYVALSEDQIIDLLGREYFEPGWELSYSYRSEALNLRRVQYVPEHELDYDWWQVHIRGYHHEAGGRFAQDTFELAPHFELEPTEHPRAHVDKVGLELRYGVETLMDILDDHDVNYEFLHPDGSEASLAELEGKMVETPWMQEA